MQTEVLRDSTEILSSLLEVGVRLTAMPNRREMLERILAEARKLVHAEAGSLYVLGDGQLKFVIATNDTLSDTQVIRDFLDKRIPLAANSLAGYVASTHQTVNIPDSHNLPEDAPYRINRKFDITSGYDTKSILAVPLVCPDGLCVGVLELINCLDDAGRVRPFPDAETGGILSLAAMAAVSIHNAMLQEELRQSHLDTIMKLSVAAEFRDEDTCDHIHRISHTSALIAKGAKLDAHMVELIRCASPMHDIGKIGIPDAILRKPGPLTAEERVTVEKHTIMGAEILGTPQNELITVARDIALHHHEHWDGQGYPHGLTGADIPIGARVVSVADVFDALVSKRYYKDAYSLDQALRVIRQEEGKHFDPDITHAFLRVLNDILPIYGVRGTPRLVVAASRN